MTPSHWSVPWYVSMRWWLGLAFALIAILTASVVAQVFVRTSDREFAAYAGQIAAGNTLQAAIAIEGSTAITLEDTVRRAATRNGVALFVFDAGGRLLTPPRSHGVPLSSVTLRDPALRSALGGSRYVRTTATGSATVVALPMRGDTAGALVAYTAHPDLVAGRGIARETLVRASWLAVAIAALAGLAVAALIATRLRRLSAAARRIEEGDFGQELHARFPDEIGSLTRSMDRMREHLRDSFSALASERDVLQGLLERLHEGVVTIDRDGDVEFSNQEARRLLAPRRVAGGVPLRDSWPEAFDQGLVASLVEPGATIVDGRVEIDGGERIFAVVGIPPSGQQESAILVFTDVSERERRERSEREFITNAAHELRTPVATISAAVEVLQNGARELPEQRDRFLEHVARETARLGRLIRTLLVLSRAQTGEEVPRLHAVEVAPVLQEVAESLVTSDCVTVEVAAPDDLCVATDRDLLEQAVRNLAGNAARYTAEGRIVLTARSLGAGGVVVEVVDTGRGIEPADQERIFDRFYRAGARDGQGFGLGLTIVQQIAVVLGATVDVESVPGVGTTARLTLPAEEQEPA